MLVFPNAKINLGLRVIRRRHDGFHDIESVIHPIALRDVLEILPAADLQEESPELKVTGSEAPEDEQNLCLKAIRMLRLKHNVPDVRIRLHKVIPVGGGLGGGSSDAAFTINVINEIYHLDLAPGILMDYAARIGSDCPFFISNVSGLVSGRGEVIRPLSPGLKGYYLLLVVPELRIDTRHAYKMVKSRSDGEAVGNIIQLPPEKWQGRLLNYFEGPIFSEYPDLRAIKYRLYETGALYASMSGSGSSLYGIFDRKPEIPAEFERHFVHVEQLD